MTCWKTVALGDVAAIERQSVDAANISAGTVYVGLENIQSGGRLINIRPVGRGELASSKFVFTPQHLLYGKLRPYLAKIARPNFSGICSTDILPVLPGPELDRNYLAHFLLQPELISLANSRAAGVNLPRLSPKMLTKFQIPLPPLPEQSRIAEVLDRAEGLRAKRRAALSQLDELVQALFLDTLEQAGRSGHEIALGKVAEESRGSFVNGPFGSDLLTSELTNIGVPVIYIRDIRNGEYRRVSTVCVTEQKARNLAVCAVQPGDVLVAKVGDPPGIAAVYPEGEPSGIVTQDVIRIRVDAARALPAFLVAYLNSYIGQRKVSDITVEATRARFSLSDYKRLTIELPPLSVQLQFVRRFNVVEQLRGKHRASLAELDALFASLQHRAFRGEL
jgi:type I restriction enzyme S subunit